jgi:serine protease DegQ
MRLRGGVVLFLVALTVGLTSGCTRSGPSGAGTPSGGSGSSSSSTATVDGSIGSGASGGLEHVPGVVAKLEPSVVTVLVSGGVGSGVVYTSDGLILTNEHVVRETRNVRLAFADGQRIGGVVKATDAVTDLALVQGDRQGLPPAKFQTRLPQVGSLAVVIGSPLGFQNTVTAGVISGLHREIPGSASLGQSLVDLVQTDAPISPGNSGGAVANAQGEVVGISEAYIPPRAGAVALGFAIPAATAVDIAEQLRRSGRARHAFAGLVPAAITPQIASELGLNSTEGVIVAEVTSGGPAERSGLRPGHVITAADAQPTRTPEDFLAALRAHKPGDTLRLTVRIPGRPDRTVDLTVTDRPSGRS